MFATVFATLLLSLTGFDAPDERLPGFSDEIFIVDGGPLVEKVSMGEKVTVVFGAGELEVLAGDGLEVRAEVEIRCPPERQKRCGKIRKRLRVEPKRTANGLEVRMRGVRASLLKRLNISGTVVVPRTSPLDVRAGYGEVDIEAGNRTTTVAMTAGDLRVTAASSEFAKAEVRTKVGDASVRQEGRLVSSRRRKLVGASAEWQAEQGSTSSEAISVRLRFGDARVVLEDAVASRAH